MRKQTHDYLLKISDPNYNPKHLIPFQEGSKEEVIKHFGKIILAYKELNTRQEVEIERFKSTIRQQEKIIATLQKTKREPINHQLEWENTNLKETIDKIKTKVEDFNEWLKLL